ncbi:hypothetical protein H4R24_004100 [Coemansia sp. RSA 988]|nr:hypothetical protein H4R24_004100 [Coemansia sp. RSA 988]
MEWSDVAYVRRNLANADSMEWDSPKVETYSDIDQGCDKASTLYSKNTDTFYCSLIHTPSLSNSNCNMPYGSIYGVVSGDTAIAGLYSHSVVYGDDTCSGDKQYHYYTVLTYYLKYARSVLGRTPKELCEDKEGLSNFKRIINYRMKWNSSANDDGTSMFGGDMLAIQPRAAVSSSDSTSASSTIMDDNDNNSRSNDIGDNSSNTSKDNDRTRNAGDDNSTVDGTDDDRTRNADDDNSTSDGADTGTDNFQTGELHHDGNDGNSKDSDNSDIEANHSDRDSSYAGPSKGAVIAMGVTIPLVVIGLAVLAYVLFRKHRKKYPLGKWRKGTIKRKSTVRALIEEIGGASRPEVLPTYSAIYDLHTLASDQQHVSEQPPSR